VPNSFAETSDGEVLIASGFDPVVAWDGFTTTQYPAGVPAPLAAPTISGVAVGADAKIVGTYRAYLRFLDARGNVGNLSPVSAEISAYTVRGLVAAATSTSPVTIATQYAHGLTTGQWVKVADVAGQLGANGLWQVTVLDPTHLILDDSKHSGTYSGGGTWAAAARTIAYTGVERPQDPRVARRQILRNTDGQQTVFYVDVDSADLTATTFSSTRDDTELAAQEAVPLFDSAGRVFANAHYEPFAHKPFVNTHQGRTFLAGSVEYTEGAVAVTQGSTVVKGVATEWTSVAAGRLLYVQDGDRVYEIASVNVPDQYLVLTEPWQASSRPYSLYAIRNDEVEDRVVYFSGGGQFSSFHPFFAFRLSDDSDSVAGTMVKGSFYYVLEKRHIYRYTVQNDPFLDGQLFTNAGRGCVNDRCWAVVEDTAYMLDEYGVHTFDDPREDTDISTQIQTLFRPDDPGPKINWRASRFFHCCYDRSTQVVRWFVALSGTYLPRHSLAYNLPLKRWTIEEFPYPVGASCIGRLGRMAPSATWGESRPITLLGTSYRRTLALAESTLDGCDPERGPTNGQVVSATRFSLTGSADFAPDVVNCPVVITDGRGRFQVRRVHAVDGPTLHVRQPWRTTPDAGSKYQVGGAVWTWQSGWLEWADEEEENVRSIEVTFRPTQQAVPFFLRRYADYQGGPEPAAFDRVQDGVRTRKGDSDVALDSTRRHGSVVLNMDSFLGQRVADEDITAVALLGVTAPELLKVKAVVVNGAVPPGGE
jgi:hypothetical protein